MNCRTTIGLQKNHTTKRIAAKRYYKSEVFYNCSKKWNAPVYHIMQQRNDTLTKELRILKATLHRQLEYVLKADYKKTVHSHSSKKTSEDISITRKLN